MQELEHEPTLYLETRMPSLSVGEAREYLDWLQSQGDMGRDVQLQSDGRIVVK